MLSCETIAPLSDEYKSFLNPSWSKSNIPVVASSPNSQPSAWAAFFFDLHFGILFLPVGLYLMLKQVSEATVLIAVYAAVG
jgi:dolichyl-diphosphooligosaccharide--protein glycosyltransferase